MSRAGFYQEFIPKFLKRLFLIGLPVSAFFLYFWYQLSGYDLWSSFLEIPFRMTSFIFDIFYDPGHSLEQAAFFYNFKLGGTENLIGYKVNNNCPNLVVVLLLLGAWPFANFKEFLKIGAWTLLFTLVYQVGSTWLQIYHSSISPDMADRLKLFWEESLWYDVVEKAQGFDKFILRYYAALPIFALALTANYFTSLKKSGKKHAP